MVEGLWNTKVGKILKNKINIQNIVGFGGFQQTAFFRRDILKAVPYDYVKINVFTHHLQLRIMNFTFLPPVPPANDQRQSLWKPEIM